MTWSQRTPGGSKAAAGDAQSNSLLVSPAVVTTGILNLLGGPKTSLSSETRTTPPTQFCTRFSESGTPGEEPPLQRLLWGCRENPGSRSNYKYAYFIHVGLVL